MEINGKLAQRAAERASGLGDGDEDEATAIGVGLAAVTYALLEVADAIRSTGQQQPGQPPRRP
jgi:hypothetical protein